MSQNFRQKDVHRSELSVGQVQRLFRKLVASGCPVRPAGSAKSDLNGFLRSYTPRYLVELFQHRYFLCNVRHDNQFRFFVGYVQLHDQKNPEQKQPLYPRIFYKDSSLIWRVATHYIKSKNEHWVGKGDVKPVQENGETVSYSAEETTNLPFEIQNALDKISRLADKTRADRRAMQLVLRDAPDHRVRPYADFSKPRKIAMASAKKRINKNQSIAWFKDELDPRSLQFAKGFEPDFRHGLIDANETRSRLYGGRILRFRIASKNKQVQYLFVHAPRQCWIIPPQAFSDEIMSYGVRTVDANADENLCIPGYEYHFEEEPGQPDSLYSQIPAGYAGEQSLIDPQRADTSPWNQKMPVIIKFYGALERLRSLSSL